MKMLNFHHNLVPSSRNFYEYKPKRYCVEIVLFINLWCDLFKVLITGQCDRQDLQIYDHTMIPSFGRLFCFMLSFTVIESHVVGDKAYLTELKKLCEHAYICFHDNIIICGKSVNEARTFLDLCDLYEYSCEYNMDM
ncbi:uncharacterized protein LOC133319465 isoform X2 [Danaus plexippus]|uniref:uncharacterized protein LOC133319465 isoform X2 n=1 Tax=Danaus plexippus TaxID=13037 RepID=UPI002AB12D5A|nr:uncharacterized protein LOC133319465 isoform X2 [Danaus plexippus]